MKLQKLLGKFLSIPEEKLLSMGEILRKTIYKAKNEKAFKEVLSENYGISESVSAFDPDKNRPEIIIKANNYKDEMKAFFGITDDFISQFNWLEFCVSNGLLVPDEWTEIIIEALFENSLEFREGIIILDGYPRTVVAAKFLLRLFERMNIPVIKVLHLFITKEQMSFRALNRKRADEY